MPFFIFLLFSPNYADVKSAPARGRRSHNWDTEHVFVNETLKINGDDRIFETTYFNEEAIGFFIEFLTFDLLNCFILLIILSNIEWETMSI